MPIGGTIYDLAIKVMDILLRRPRELGYEAVLE
jgi:hypothetical protein